MSKTEERKQFIFDVFVTALEGGIGYWANVSKYCFSKNTDCGIKEDLDGFYAKVSDCEGDEIFPDNSVINHEVIVKGINKIAKYNDLKISNSIRERIKEANRLNDAGIIDANDADCIVQVGLLGELVFG